MRRRAGFPPYLRAPPIVLATWLTIASRARAADPFEIQVYDGTANAPGVPGLELHLNDWATGHRDSTPPERPLNGQFHSTLEPSLGVTPFWELGAYWQMAARTGDGVLDWAGAKLRSKFVTPPSWDPHWRLGTNFEIAYLPSAYDRDQWGLEVRPIVAWHDHLWLFALNPILDQSLAGGGAREGPTLEPALKIARAVGPVALGLEYYGSVGPLSAPLPLESELHFVYGVVDVLSIPGVELNLGVGEGLTAASTGTVVKAILGYTFEPAPPRAPSAAMRAPVSRGFPLAYP
ncbi:MAG: hypothetical protein JOZ69_16050 [Myxococcales bacterium]|nr:hypothetical protein [Myxococcales bacterium]